MAVARGLSGWCRYICIDCASLSSCCSTFDTYANIGDHCAPLPTFIYGIIFFACTSDSMHNQVCHPCTTHLNLTQYVRLLSVLGHSCLIHVHAFSCRKPMARHGRAATTCWRVCTWMGQHCGVRHTHTHVCDRTLVWI